MLFEKHNYTNKSLSYLKNTPITEYDMENAGINILFHNNIITKDEYDKLNSMGKLEKNIVVGKFLKNNADISKFLMEEFISIRKSFFEINNIQDDSVLSIKKDAIFLIDKNCTNLELNEHYRFKSKNRYSSYININKNEFYLDSMYNKLDVKGYSDIVKKHHEEYLFKFLKDILHLDSVSKNTDKIYLDLLEFKHRLITLDLPKEYYFDINGGSYLFELEGIILSLDHIDDNLKKHCIISSNLEFILRIINIIL